MDTFQLLSSNWRAPVGPDLRERDIAKIAVKTVKSGLRAADVLFRNEQDEFVALLGGTSSEAAIQVVRRIAERLREQESGFEKE